MPLKKHLVAVSKLKDEWSIQVLTQTKGGGKQETPLCLIKIGDMGEIWLHGRGVKNKKIPLCPQPRVWPSSQ